MLAGVDVLDVWCDMSTNECVWAARTLHEMHREGEESKTDAKRRIRFRCFHGANHFVSRAGPSIYAY